MLSLLTFVVASLFVCDAAVVCGMLFAVVRYCLVSFGAVCCLLFGVVVLLFIICCPLPGDECCSFITDG